MIHSKWNCAVSDDWFDITQNIIVSLLRIAKKFLFKFSLHRTKTCTYCMYNLTAELGRHGLLIYKIEARNASADEVRTVWLKTRKIVDNIYLQGKAEIEVWNIWWKEILLNIRFITTSRKVIVSYKYTRIILSSFRTVVSDIFWSVYSSIRILKFNGATHPNGYGSLKFMLDQLG